MNYARTGRLALALVLTPIAFLLLVSSGSKMALNAATALLGLSSGFVLSVAVSITSGSYLDLTAQGSITTFS